MCITGALIGGTVLSSLAGASSANKAAKAQERAANQANETERYVFDRSVELTEPQRRTGNNALAALAFELGIGPGPSSQPVDLPEIQQIDEQLAATPRYNIQMDEPGAAARAISQPVLPGQTVSSFRVGDATFDTREAAESYRNSLAPNDFSHGGFQASPSYEFQRNEGLKALERMASARGMRLGSGTLKNAARFSSNLAANEYGNYLNRLAGVAGVGQTATGQQLAAGQSYATSFGQNSMAAGNARASGYINQNNAFQGGMNGLFNVLGMRQAGLLGG